MPGPSTVIWTAHFDENEVACLLVGLNSFVPTDGPEGERIMGTLRRKLEKKLKQMNPDRFEYLVSKGAITPHTREVTYAQELEA